MGAGAGVDVAKNDGATPLLIAAAKGHLDVVRELVGAGPGVDVAEDTGATPLYVAAQEGHLDVVRELVGACNELHSVIRSYSAPDRAFPRVLVKILNGYCFGRPCDRVRSSQFTGAGGASLSPSSSTPPRHLTRFAPWRLTEGEIAGCDSTFESHARLSRFALPSLTRCTSSVRRAPVIHNQWLH